MKANLNIRADMTVAMLLGCDSFESVYADVLKIDRDQYINSFRNDWSWHCAQGLVDNNIRPILYLPSLHEAGRHVTSTPGIYVRFLPIAVWYRLLAPFRRICQVSRWSTYGQERLNAMAFMKPLREALAEDRAGLLYVQDPWGGRFDHVVPRLNVPVSSIDQRGVAARAVTKYKRTAFEKANTCYGQTTGECKRIESFGGRAQLQPNGCDVEEFSHDPAVVRGKTIIVLTDVLDKPRRISDLIRALPKLSADWILDIVGNVPDRDTLVSLARSVSVLNRVRFHGFKGRADLLNLLRRCGVFAVPSTGETACLALLEAMATGASVVASQTRACEAVIEDGVNGRIVPVADVEALASAVENAWKQREDYGHAAVATVMERYNSKVLYRRLAESIRVSAGRMPTSATMPATTIRPATFEAVPHQTV